MKLVVLCSLVATCLALMPPMPTFLWSQGEVLLKTTSGEVTEPLSQSDIVNLVKFYVGEQDAAPPAMKSQLSEGKPELVLLFVQPQLHTAQVTSLSSAFDHHSTGGSLPNLKESIESAEASLTFPYTYKTDTLPLLEELHKVERVHVVDAEDAPAFMHGKQWMYKDEQTDVVVVRFKPASSSDDFASKIQTDDRLMGQMVRKANEETKGNFLAVFTANTPAPSGVAKAVSLAAQQSMVQTKAQAKTRSRSKQANKDDGDGDGNNNNNNNNGDNDIVYMTPGLLSGLLVGLVLFMIVSVGVMGLAALETPDSWEGEGGFLQGN